MSSNQTMRSQRKANRVSTTAQVLDMCRRIYRLIGQDTVSVEKYHEIQMPDPKNFDEDAQAFAKAYLSWSLLRKNQFLETVGDLDAVALKQFLQVEERMAYTNKNLLNDCHDVAAVPVLYRAQRKISRLLGKFSWDNVVPLVAITGGASTRLPRRQGSVGFKLRGKPHCTREAQQLCNLFLYSDQVYMRGLLEAGPVRPDSLTTVVSQSRLCFVPKDTRKNRTIAIEPELNMMFQRGIGKLLKKKLLRVGIDLSDQTRNQSLAFHGSVMGNLATIDLEAASDSVSLEICRQLLPPDWMDAMELVRCKTVELPDGSSHKLHKISSMGNGFTFELETLVFWALAKAVCDEIDCVDKTVAVYGDDIIVSTEAAARLIEVLRACGFRTNHEKTFVDGPFRESCGKHYFRGRDVTPFNVKKLQGNVTDALFLTNSFRLWWHRLTGQWLSEKRLGLRGSHPVVPPSYGLRAGLIETSFSMSPYKADENGCFRIEYYAFKKRRTVVPHFGLYWATLLSPSPETQRSLCFEETTQLVRRKSEHLVSFWE